MKEKFQIVLGSQDVAPKKNKDIFLDVELFQTSDELVKEIIDNNFNLLDQFNKEREDSLKFCVYGTINSIISDTENSKIRVNINHYDEMHSPRIEIGSNSSISQTVLTKPLSKDNVLSKNIFNKNKSSYFFLFELSPNYNNKGETKNLVLTINNEQRRLYYQTEVPIIYYDSFGNKVLYGTETSDIDENGNEQIIENDFPFFYGVHWIKNDINIVRILKASFCKSEFETQNNYTIQENDLKADFFVKLEAPSVTGKEVLEVYIIEDDTVRNPGPDYIFIPQTVSWSIGEQFKKITVDIINDNFAEPIEKLVFGIRNKQYVDEDIKNTFNLSIKDDDYSTIRFETSFKSITENGRALDVKILADKPLKIENQTFDVVLNKSLTTAIAGKDFENTFVGGGNLFYDFKRTVNFQKGASEAAFSIYIPDDNEYEFTKSVFLNLKHPSQNLLIDPAGDTIQIEIKDSMKVQHTRYTFPGDIKKGYGIFKMNQASDNSRNLNFINDSTDVFGVTNLFSYSILVYNLGEPIIYNGYRTGKNEVVQTFELTNGFNGFSIDLPSNTNIDSQNKVFKQSNYKFVIKTTSQNLTNIFSTNPLFLSSIYPDITIDAGVLDSSINLGEKEYFLVSEFENVNTRLSTKKLDSSLPDANYYCYNSIIETPINIKINGLIVLNQAFLTTLSNGLSFQPNAKRTKPLRYYFDSILADYKYCESSSNKEFLLPAEPI